MYIANISSHLPLPNANQISKPAVNPPPSPAKYTQPEKPPETIPNVQTTRPTPLHSSHSLPALRSNFPKCQRGKNYPPKPETTTWQYRPFSPGTHHPHRVSGQTCTVSRARWLDLNLFNDTFPKEIGRLSNLEERALAFIDFVPSSIPVEFGQLKNLVHLDLAGNDLEGKIPDGLFLLKNLTNLYLFKNLSGEIPQTVETLSLVEIDLAMNQLNGSIPEDFSKLKKLQLLNLFENHLSGEVPASICLLPELRTLKVFANNLSGFLPPKMGLHSTLEEFDVSTNQFSGQLPENLCAGGVLQGVVASENNLSGQVPQSLGNCNSLRTVRLYSNNFSGEIPAGIWTAFNMTYLMLSENSFSGGLPSKLAWNLSRCELNNNRFSGPIHHGVSSWVNLVVFEASSNWFTGEIPLEITSMPHLSNLLLDGNQFSGQLPSKILSWKSLTSLNLSRNGLSGQIPKEIGSLPDLLDLDLSKNHFSGEIPPEFGQLKLIFLNLSSNNLSGKIPDQFNNLAYDNSFLKNSELCVIYPILNLPDCYSKRRDSKTLFSKILSLILVLTVTILFVTIIVTLFMVRDYQRRKQKRDLALWKLTSFQRLDFTEANILANLTENNLIGSGGSGKVYRIAINRAGDFVAVKRIWNYEEMDHKLGKGFRQSFGVVLLELATGREPNGGDDEHTSLAEWGWRQFGQGKPIFNSLDREIKESCFLQEMTTVFDLGLICTHTLPSTRPPVKRCFGDSAPMFSSQ
ncbi:hypothetical protein SADUNF_Sadunf18G0043800 [Salix dunnii]|uniref:Protein kinase domain-containing protein n=1 Tax=Salix dunnii TaxID=1413687 RepID=A0A835J3X0_9ROSI|nr:hypothetical protein SADUNF_Sadunf18G0043800 [Salix dunnii]